MLHKKRLAACTAVVSALAFAVVPANATNTPVNDRALGSPRCPADYTGPTNLATGCPFWLMIY
jgi:hypothetical protein